MGQVVAVVSGKGGAGKTSICAGVAVSLAEAGQRVLCIDADVGLRNLDISLGMTQEPAVPFTAVMRREYPLSCASVHPKLPGLCFLTAPLTETAEELDADLLGELLEEVREEFDWCLIDAPAGIGAGFRLAVSHADQVMIVTAGEPASLRDGARTAQFVETYSEAASKIVVNRIRKTFFKRTKSTVDDCMDTVGLPLLGIVPEDEDIPLAAAQGRMPNGQKRRGAGEACRHIAARLMGKKQALMRL